MRFRTYALLALASLVPAAAAGAQSRCRDFSGTYVLSGEDGSVFYTIAQTACARVGNDTRAALDSAAERSGPHC